MQVLYFQMRNYDKFVQLFIGKKIKVVTQKTILNVIETGQKCNPLMSAYSRMKTSSGHFIFSE